MKPARIAGPRGDAVRAIDAKLGRTLAIPGTDRIDERTAVLEGLDEWLRFRTAGEIAGRCEAFARSLAHKRKDVYALKLLVDARDEVERFEPGDRPEQRDLPPEIARGVHDLFPYELVEFYRELDEVRSLPKGPATEDAQRAFLAKWTGRSPRTGAPR